MDRRARIAPIAPPLLALGLALALAPVAAGPADGAETLRWKFSQGDTHRYELKQTMVNSAKVAENEFMLSTFQTVGMTWEVLSVEEDGSARVGQTIDRVRVALESPFANFAYDSQEEAAAEGPAAALKPVIDALVGARIVLVMTPRGEVRDVEVPEEMIAKLKAAGQAAQSLQNLSTAEGMKGLIGQSTLVLPEEAIEQGHTWSRQVELPTPQGTMVLTNAFTFEGTEGQGEDAVSRIAVAMNVDEFRADPDSPIRLTVKEQDGSGSYAFDPNAGVLRSSEVSQTLTVVVTAEGQEVTSTAESTATFALADE